MNIDPKSLKIASEVLPEVFSGINLGEVLALQGGDITEKEKAGVWGFAKNVSNNELGLLIAAPPQTADVLTRFGFQKPKITDVAVWDHANPEALANRELFWFPSQLLNAVLLKNQATELIPEFSKKVEKVAEKKVESKKESNTVAAATMGAAVMSTEGFIPQLKQDAIDGLYRVAAKRMNQALRDLIVDKMRGLGWDDGKLAVLSSILDTEVGLGIQSFLIGVALDRLPVPQLTEDPRVAQLAREFRVEGTSVASEMVAGLFLGEIVPGLMGIFSDLPEKEEAPDLSSKILKEEEKVVEHVTVSAKSKTA